MCSWELAKSSNLDAEVSVGLACEYCRLVPGSGRKSESDFGRHTKRRERLPGYFNFREMQSGWASMVMQRQHSEKQMQVGICMSPPAGEDMAGLKGAFCASQSCEPPILRPVVLLQAQQRMLHLTATLAPCHGRER